MRFATVHPEAARANAAAVHLEFGARLVLVVLLRSLADRIEDGGRRRRMRASTSDSRSGGCPRRRSRPRRARPTRARCAACASGWPGGRPPTRSWRRTSARCSTGASRRRAPNSPWRRCAAPPRTAPARAFALRTRSAPRRWSGWSASGAKARDAVLARSGACPGRRPTVCASAPRRRGTRAACATQRW